MVSHATAGSDRPERSGWSDRSGWSGWPGDFGWPGIALVAFRSARISLRTYWSGRPCGSGRPERSHDTLDSLNALRSLRSRDACWPGRSVWPVGPGWTEDAPVSERAGFACGALEALSSAVSVDARQPKFNGVAFRPGRTWWSLRTGISLRTLSALCAGGFAGRWRRSGLFGIGRLLGVRGLIVTRGRFAFAAAFFGNLFAFG